MKPLQAIKRFFTTKAFDPLENINLNNVVGWRSIGGSSTYGYYQDRQYENGYSSIRVLAEGFAIIEQYTIDKTGKAVPSNLLDRLYTPNTDMSAYDFREALMVCSLVQDKVRLRVHHKGTRINLDSITGFTFMEGYTENIVGGKRIYQLPNGEKLEDDEVVTLKSFNPDNITGGFSPSRAAQRWTRLDDYIADYQRGFFENGAIPSGQLIITARTVGEFNDIVDKLEARHKGASKHNNITYTHRPTDQNGAPLNSQIEWVPFSSANKDMALKDLFDNVNKKIDSAYGVPASLRAVNDANTYASVRVDELILVKYALNPKALKVWSKFTHELNRITGGMGVAITYKLDIPVIADEEKVRSEAKQLDATTVSTLTAEGYTLESAVEYVKTGNLTVLVLGEPPEEDKPEVLSPEEARGTPDQPIDMYSKHFQVLEMKVDKLLEAPTTTGSKKLPLKTKQLSEIDQAVYEYKFMGITRNQMKRQVDKAIARLDEALAKKAYGDTTEEEDKQFTAEILALMLPLMYIYGNRAVNTGMNLIFKADLETNSIKRFEFTPAQRKAYEKYLAQIGVGYAEQTAEQIRQVLGRGILDGATKAEIEDRLRIVILGPENEYRVRRLAVTEINTSEARASVNAMQNIQQQTGYELQKRKVHHGADAPCEFCASLLAEDWRNVDDSYLPEGKELVGIEGGVYNNNWRSIDSGDVHANGHCGDEFRVVKD